AYVYRARLTPAVRAEAVPERRPSLRALMRIRLRVAGIAWGPPGDDASSSNATVARGPPCRSSWMYVVHHIDKGDGNGRDDDHRRNRPGQVPGRGGRGTAILPLHPGVPVIWIDVDLAHVPLLSCPFMRAART